jgi:molybdopterin synthase sulfur carrier subunit
MKIKLFAGLRQVAGRSQVDAAGATLREALEHLCAGDEDLRAAIFDGHVLHPHVRVLINGRDSELAQGLDTPLTEDDQVAVFPPIAGGSSAGRD